MVANIKRKKKVRTSVNLQADIFASCISCTHHKIHIAQMEPRVEVLYCTLFEVFPPPHIIVDSCGDKYDDDDDIPF